MKKIVALAMIAALATAARAENTLNFRVDLNFDGLSGNAPFGLQFDLSDSLNSFETSSVTFSNFVVNGGAFTGTSQSWNTDSLVTGEIGSSFTMMANGSVGLSDFWRDFDAGVTSISFDVAATSSRAGIDADGLAIFVYDADAFLASNAPDGASLLNLNLSNEAVFADIGTYAGQGITASVSAIPEPSTYGLMGACAFAGAALIRRRRANKAA